MVGPNSGKAARAVKFLSIAAICCCCCPTVGTNYDNYHQARPNKNGMCKFPQFFDERGCEPRSPNRAGFSHIENSQLEGLIGRRWCPNPCKLAAHAFSQTCNQPLFVRRTFVCPRFFTHMFKHVFGSNQTHISLLIKRQRISGRQWFE